MIQANPQTDPIVEILRLAYRRGIVIRQEQEKQSQIDKPKNSVNQEDVHTDTAIHKHTWSNT